MGKLLTWYSHGAEDPVLIVVVLSPLARLVSLLLFSGPPASVLQTAGALQVVAAGRGGAGPAVQLLPRAVDEPLPLRAQEERRGER